MASLAGIGKKELKELRLDGVEQSDMLFQKDGKSARTEFVYNMKTSPFRAGYRMGDYKLLWGDQPKVRTKYLISKGLLRN